MACELFYVLKLLNPNLVCKKDCTSEGVECGIDIKLIEEKPIPQSKPVGVSASYNAETVPTKVHLDN